MLPINLSKIVIKQSCYFFHFRRLSDYIHFVTNKLQLNSCWNSRFFFTPFQTSPFLRIAFVNDRAEQRGVVSNHQSDPLWTLRPGWPPDKLIRTSWSDLRNLLSRWSITNTNCSHKKTTETSYYHEGTQFHFVFLWHLTRERLVLLIKQPR